MRSIRVLGIPLASLLVLAGCASPAGVPSSTPTPGTFTSEPVVQERETGLVRPTLVFDGLCDALFSDADLQAVMGEPLALGDNHFVELWAGDAVFNQNGGFECTWWGARSRVLALVLPEAAVDYSPQEHPCDYTHDAGVVSCPMESVVNGIRLSGLAGIGDDPAAATAARDALLEIFAAKAQQQAPVLVPLPAMGAWQVPTNCTAAAGADFSAVPGLGAGATDGGPPGYGKDTTQAEQAMPVSPSCILQGESAQIEYVAVGGARWMEVSIAARADVTPLPLDGVESAYAVPYSPELTLVYAFSGPNMLAFTVRYTKNAAGIATAFFASLDTTAVS